MCVSNHWWGCAGTLIIFSRAEEWGETALHCNNTAFHMHAPPSCSGSLSFPPTSPLCLYPCPKLKGRCSLPDFWFFWIHSFLYCQIPPYAVDLPPHLPWAPFLVPAHSVFTSLLTGALCVADLSHTHSVSLVLSTFGNSWHSFLLCWCFHSPKYGHTTVPISELFPRDQYHVTTVDFAGPV